ncbi:hypothetical protein BDW42DRAFT_95090 [Aspergillus taichungensis]|uniref:Uncharacterized protein n=1 Tax=Aspergillus taichungensis TaxID=482145 RepID=A0A2J5HVY4_9EURO|nr:hypothetical protein BDW42DRAFT_95090 [Aspergillus taichungensis]
MLDGAPSGRSRTKNGNIYWDCFFPSSSFNATEPYIYDIDVDVKPEYEGDHDVDVNEGHYGGAAYAGLGGFPLAKRQEIDYPDTEAEAAEAAEAATLANDDHDSDVDVVPDYDIDQDIDVDIKPDYDYDQDIDVDIKPDYDLDQDVDVDVDVDIDGTDNNEKYEDELEGGIRAQLEAAALAGAY